MQKIILTILLGITAGLLGGSMGQSGAEFMLPGLLILGIVPDFKTAAGTILLTIVAPISILAVYEYYQRKEVIVTVSLTLMICYLFAAFLGAYLTKNVSNTVLEYMTGFYFLIISMFFFWNAYTGRFGKK